MSITTPAAVESFLIELDSQSFPVQSADGGAPAGVVVESPAGTSPFREKHLAGVQYEPFRMDIGSFEATQKPLFEWVKTSWQGTHAQKSGAMMRVGVNGRPVSRREFLKAVVTETTIPKLDASSHDSVYVTVILVPELTRDVTPPATLPPPGPGRPNTLISSNFRLSIGGLDCTKVSKIDSFKVTQTVTGALEFPNLRIELAAASAESWRAWFRSFVIAGNSGSANEKSGSLSFLTPNLASVLATISFQNLGIFRLENAPTEASGEISRLVADLYCERMDLAIGSPGHAAPNW
jgi:hypothetical protein